MKQAMIRTEQESHARILTIDRPQARNALSREAGMTLAAQIEAAGSDPDVRAIIITGAGDDVFVAGGDLRDYDSLPSNRDGAAQVTRMRVIPEAIERSKVPVIAAVQGDAYGGGCELLTACDIVVLEQHVKLHFKQAAMGLATGWGGGIRLVERVGAMMASRLLFTGEVLDASAALRIGLASDVAPTGQSLHHALLLTEQMAKLPRESLTAMKQVLLAFRQNGRSVALERERQVFADLWGGPEHRAAMDAFFRRSPTS